MSENSTLRALLPPCALVLALILAVSAFALLWVGEPEVGIELHRARLNPDQNYAAPLEERFESKKWAYRVGVGVLFTSATLSVAGGFWAMKGR
jgi:hypothetical protein